MPRNPTTWAEYTTDEIAATTTGGDVHRIVRVFGSEVAALRSAVANGSRVTRLEYGETIEQALERVPAVDAEQLPVYKVKRSTALADDVVYGPAE